METVSAWRAAVQRRGRLTQDEGHPVLLRDAVVGAVDHLDDLVELLLPAATLVDGHLEDEAAAAEQLEAVDEVLVQHGAVGLVLQQVAKALDLGPGVGGGVADAVEVALQDGGPAGDRRPGDHGEAQGGVAGAVALAVGGLAEGEAAHPGDLRKRLLPAGAVGGARGEVVLAVGLDDDEAQQRGRRLGGAAVLVDRVLAGEVMVRAAPGEGGGLVGGVEVDVGVDDGEDDLVVGHGDEGGGRRWRGDGGEGEGDELLSLVGRLPRRSWPRQGPPWTPEIDGGLRG